MIKTEVNAPVRGLAAAMAAVGGGGPNTPNIGAYRPVAVGTVNYSVSGIPGAEDFTAVMAVVFASKNEADINGRPIGLRVFLGTEVEAADGELVPVHSDFEGIDPGSILAWADAEAKKPWAERDVFEVASKSVERANSDGRKYTQRVRYAKASATVLEHARAAVPDAAPATPEKGEVTDDKSDTK